MSISKLLMTAAVCTISMSAVSTSYASVDSLREGEEPSTPCGERARAADSMSMSQYSSASAKNSYTTKVLKELGAELQGKLAEDVIVFPTDAELKGKRSVEQLQLIVTNLLRGYLGLRPMVTAFIDIRDVVLPEQAKKPLSDLDASKSEIISKIKQQETELALISAKLSEAENAAARWKNGTFVTTTVFVVVAGFLANIIKNHGFSIIFKGK